MDVPAEIELLHIQGEVHLRSAVCLDNQEQGSHLHEDKQEALPRGFSKGYTQNSLIGS